MRQFETVVVGAGIVGLATAHALLRARPGRRVAVLEKEAGPARHQTGHNSGVIHAGLYYAPASRKAALCRRGRAALLAFARENEIPFEVCGKLVVAKNARELAALDALQARGEANGLTGLVRIPGAAIAEYEPYVVGAGALVVPETGIVDFPAVAAALARRIGELGGEIRFGAAVRAVAEDGGALAVETDGAALRAAGLVNCAGLHADRVARLCGAAPGLRIVPFRGEYYRFVPARRAMVRNLVYPVPDPRFPFLGVHFTRTIEGDVECGPNAVLALAREGYEKGDFDLRDAASTLAYRGFRRLAARHWRYGAGELRRSYSKRAFTAALRELMPALEADWLEPFGAGVRAQAVAEDGALVDDFAFARSPRAVHVLNAPSPAATASLAIGETVAAMALEI